MEITNPFTRLSIDIELDLNALLIFLIWISRKATNLISHKQSGANLPKPYILYFLLFYGIFVGILNYDLIESLDTACYALRTPAWVQILNTSLWIFSVILFISILLPYRNDQKFHRLMLIVFMSTIFVNFTASAFGWFQFLKPKDLIARFTEMNRFMGMFRDSGIIVEYCLIVVAFSLMMIRTNKIFSITCIIIALFTGFFSGTRSFIIMLLIFPTVLYILSVFSKKIYRIQLIIKSLIVIVSIILIYLILSDFLEGFVIFERLSETKDLVYKKDYETASNRDIEGIPVVFENISLLGAGAGYFYTINHHQMVSHNLVLAMYAKYGILGIFCIIYLLNISLKKLYIIITDKKTNISFLFDSMILFSLILTLFIDQLKTSFINASTGLLFYSFLFIIVYFKYYNFTELVQQKTSIKSLI